MFTNNLQGFGIQKSIADFQNFNSAQEKNAASSGSQSDQVSVGFPKFLNLTYEKESFPPVPDKLVKNMGQAKKKKRKRIYSPRKKPKKITSEFEAEDTDETVNWDLEALAKEATGKGQDFDSPTADLNDIFMTVGQELEKEVKKNAQVKNLIETGTKNVLNEEKLLTGTSSNLTNVWHISSNSNSNISLQKDHNVSCNKTNSNVNKLQKMVSLLPPMPKNKPLVQQDVKSVQMLTHETPPVLTQEGQTSYGSVLKTLLMPELKNVLPNPNIFPPYVPIRPSISIADKNSHFSNKSVKAGKNNMKGSDNAGVSVGNPNNHQYGMTFHPNSPQQLSTAYSRNNFLHFTNRSHMENEQSKTASYSRPTSTFRTQMNFHQTHFPSLVNVNVKTDSTNVCNSSNEHMIKDHSDYVYDMDFEVEPEKDSCENLIPPTLIKEERISDEENADNLDKQISKTITASNSDNNISFSVASNVSATTHSMHDEPKSSNVSPIEETESLPLSEYLTKFQNEGKIITAVKKINPKNALSQKTASAPLLSPVLDTNAKKQPKAKRKATNSGVKSPRKKSAKSKLDLFTGSVNENCPSTSNVAQADNSTYCGKNQITPEKSEVVGKNLDTSNCIMKTENPDLHVEMSFEEDVCDKQSHVENVKDLLAFPKVQESTNLSKNETQSKIDSLPLLPFIKTEPIFISESAAESDKHPEHNNDLNSASDILDKSHEVQNENTVDNNAAVSAKSNTKRERKRVRKGTGRAGKRKNKAAKLNKQSKNDDKMTSNENCTDASVSLASELPVNNNVPIVLENGNETPLKDDAITNRDIGEQNNDSISTLIEDGVPSLIDEDSVSTNPMNTFTEDVEIKSNNNQKKKKRNRKKTSWYPKKRKRTPKKKVAGEEESSELGSQTKIAADNVETLSFIEDNVQDNESNISNLKETINTPSKVLKNSQKAVSILKAEEHLQNNALSLNKKCIDASTNVTQKDEEISTFSSVNSIHKTTNSAELSTGNINKFPENNTPPSLVSIDELRQTLSSIKKEKEDSTETANCNENVPCSSASQHKSQIDTANNLSKSSGNDTVNTSLNLVNDLLSVKTEKPDEPTKQCKDKISHKTTETVTAAFASNELNTGHPKNSNVYENTTGHKINQKQHGDIVLNHMIHKDDEKSTKTDISSKSSNFESIRQNITCTENSVQNTSIPVNQVSALPNYFSLDTNLLKESDFRKVLLSIKKEKGEEEKTSKSFVNSKEISNEAKTESVLDKTESNFERTRQHSAIINTSQCDKTLCPIKKETPEAGVERFSNSENISAHLPDAINASNSSKHTLSSNEEILTQNKELNLNCTENLTEKEQAIVEKNNLVGCQFESSQSTQHHNISVDIAHIKKERDTTNAKPTTVPISDNLQCDSNLLSSNEIDDKCSSVTGEKLHPLLYENDTTVKLTKQALNSNLMFNTISENIPQFHNYLMSKNQNYFPNLHQNNEQMSSVNNSNLYSAINNVAGFPKFNIPLSRNNCSPSSQYKSSIDDSDYASDYSTPVVSFSNEPICNVPVHPVSAKCSNEFFKYPHPAEINLTKSKPKFRNRSKAYTRVETASMSLTLKEVTEKLKYFENNGPKSGNKLGDIVRVCYFPLCKHEIECYHRIHRSKISQKLLSMVVKSDQESLPPSVQRNVPNAFQLQNSQVPNRTSSAHSEFNEMEILYEEKKECHKMIPDSQFDAMGANITNSNISPIYSNYLPTRNNVTPHSMHHSGSLNPNVFGTDAAVDSKAWQDIFKAVQTLNSLQHVPFENKYLGQSVADWNETSHNFHSSIEKKIIPNLSLRSQSVSSDTFIGSGEGSRTRHEYDMKSTSNERNEKKFSNIHNIQLLFNQMAEALEPQNNAHNASYQENNTLHAVSEEKKIEPEHYPAESHEWRRMDSSLPTVEQNKSMLEATVLESNERNQEITKNESSIHVDKSNLMNFSIQSAVQNVNVTELQKILELAANITDVSQKQKEKQMCQDDQAEEKQEVSTLIETPYYSDIATDKVKEDSDRQENSELNSISLVCNNKKSPDVDDSEKSQICSVSEIGKNKSALSDLSNFNTKTMSDSDDEPVDNEMLVDNESCHSNEDQSDTETSVILKEDTEKGKKSSNADERTSPPIPQYKSKWEKIMERKALEAEKNKVNEYLLKDCFPVSAKISKNKKTVDLNADVPKVSEKKKKHKKSKHVSKKDKASKISKKSQSAKLKKPAEILASESNSKSDTSNVKISDMKDPKKLNTSKIHKLQKSPNTKITIGHKKQDEHSKRHMTKSNSKELKQKYKNKSIDDGSELFKPDPVVLKTDETNSSKRFYGNRITNRGSFLTESSDKPVKAKPVVVKKTVVKSKGVPSVRTEEYHSVIESPDVNIHSFSFMQSSKHSVPSGRSNFSNRQNMTLNSTNSSVSFNKCGNEKSQVNDFEDFRCLSSQVSLNSPSSILRLAKGANDHPPSQNNLRTENYLADESFSSFSTQSSYLTPNSRSKEFEMLSNLMNFNKKSLNQSSPVFETFVPTSPALSHTQPASSLGDASPFDNDSKNLLSPVFSERINVHQSNSQSVRLNSGRCICLPPRQLKLNVGHTIIDSLNVLLLILEWNVDWLFQQQKNHDPPPISKSLHKVSDKYETYEEYYNTFLPLMLLETWQRIYVSWTHLHQAHPYFCEILSYSEESSYINVECQTAYNAHDHDKSVFPEEGNIIMVKFGTKTKGGIKILGYVTGIKIRPFNAATDTKNFSNRNLKNIRDDQIHMLKLTFMGAYASDDFDRKQPIRVQVLCNIKSTLKQNDALLFVDKSPLHRNILNPLDSGLSSVTLPPRSVLKEPDRVNECVKEIIKGIVSPHPIPLLTVIKSLPSSDRLLILPPLISKMKTSYRTKVLLCTRTTKALAEIGLCLEDHQINIVIVGKRADTHVKLRKYLLDDLAMSEINKNSDTEDSLLKGTLQKEHIKPDVLSKAKQLVLTECDVMLCLIRNSHDDMMAQTFYDNECIAHMCCIVDEANLCTEPETLIPLMYGISKLILIGDPDVPAKVCSKSAINLDYKRSLFHRAYDLDLISD